MQVFSWTHPVAAPFALWRHHRNVSILRHLFYLHLLSSIGFNFKAKAKVRPRFRTTKFPFVNSIFAKVLIVFINIIGNVIQISTRISLKSPFKAPLFVKMFLFWIYKSPLTRPTAFYLRNLRNILNLLTGIKIQTNALIAGYKNKQTKMFHYSLIENKSERKKEKQTS